MIMYGSIQLKQMLVNSLMSGYCVEILVDADLKFEYLWDFRINSLGAIYVVHFYLMLKY